MTGGNTIHANQDAITILAKPSDHVEAYFENTSGLVEGVKDVNYSNKIVIREIDSSAKRQSANDGAAFNTFSSANQTNNAVTAYGLVANTGGTETMNWVDDRDPAIKIGYDEVNQRLTFDGVNADLGKGTGVGFDAFTVYSKKLTTVIMVWHTGTWRKSEVSLKSNDLLLGEAFLADGPEIRPNNKRYGMEVEFDTVNNSFNIKSGTR